MKLAGKKIMILATNGFEQAELEVPRDRLKAAGATVEIVSPEKGEITGWQEKDWGRAVKVDRALDDAKADDYDAIVLPWRTDQSRPAAHQRQGAQADPHLLQAEEGRRGRLPCAVAADRDRHHQGPQSHFLQVDQDRHDQCGRDLGGFNRGHGPGHHHVAQSRRSRSVLQKDHRGGRRRPAYEARGRVIE